MSKRLSDKELRAEIIRLGPWHLDIEVRPGVTTGAYAEAVRSGEVQVAGEGDRNPDHVSMLRPRHGWDAMIRRLYPSGLEGRSFLDCACNCGAYSFWMKEMGAERCFGFDVRDHWLDQARFLKEHREASNAGIEFGVLNVTDVPTADLGRFDLTMFQGIFYHLPDPVMALKGAADLTDDVLVLDTAVRVDLPDGMLAVARERPDENAMMGVHGLNWFPTGPQVLREILRWLEFEEMRVAYWRTKTHRRGRKGYGRMRVLAAREKGRLKGIRNVTEPTEVDERQRVPVGVGQDD
jgi:SAM-dependent methyltransferase